MADKLFKVKASKEDWRQIENCADIPQGDVSRALVELRDRVAALEAERVAPEASTEPTPPAAVPSDRDLWEVQLKARSQSRPHIGWQVWSPESEAPIAAYRALYDHGYERGLAAGRGEQGGTPEPQPDAPQTLHSVALGHVDGLRRLGVIPQIRDTLRRAIQEPMAEPKPTPEPNQAPAGDGGGLVEEIRGLLGHQFDSMARAIILAHDRQTALRAIRSDFA